MMTDPDISRVLRDLASQENCDGEPYDQMIEAANEIDRLRALLAGSSKRIPDVLAQIDREFGGWPEGSVIPQRERGDG